MRVGISLLVGVLMGTAAGSFVTSRATEWRAASDGVDTLAQWRGRTDGDVAAVNRIEARERGALLPVSDGCVDCSDFERGYAWARSSGVSNTAGCEAYSWSYQRGCLAWLRTGRPTAAGLGF